MIHTGDALTVLRRMRAGSVQTCVTSPPYWGLRDYGVKGQMGLESTPEAYVERMVEVFRAVWRVLKDDGTLWLNLGDSYAGSWGAQSRGGPPSEKTTLHGGLRKLRCLSAVQIAAHPRHPTLKPKDLVGIPWRVAFALQADGWWLRSDIIWHKPNPMPESVRDRPTKAHEYIFLLSKSPKYFYDADAIKEPSSKVGRVKAFGNKAFGNKNAKAHLVESLTGNMRPGVMYEIKPFRNRRTVWTVTPQPYVGAHFATFPPKLIEHCILAGSRRGDLVLDPFAGAGTTGMVALQHGRRFTGIELNPEYVRLAETRMTEHAPLVLRRAA